MTATEPWLTQRELAAKLKVSRRTIQRLDPPCMMVGGQKRYVFSEVESHLREEGEPAEARGECLGQSVGPQNG